MIGKLKALVVGFVLGIFLAPRSGEASRRMLIDRIEEFLDIGDGKYERLESELAARRAERRRPAQEWPEAEESLADHPLEDETIE